MTSSPHSILSPSPPASSPSPPYIDNGQQCFTKQFHHIVEYLGFYLETNLKGDSMAKKSFKKISTKIYFLYRQRFEFLNPKLRRLLCNSLIQPHFDYVFVYWNL